MRQFEELKNLFVSSINLFIFYSLALNYNQCLRCNLIPRTVSLRKGNHYKIMKSLLMLIPFWAFFNIDFATCTVYIEDNKAQLDNAIGLNTYIHEGQHNCHRQNQPISWQPSRLFYGKSKEKHEISCDILRENWITTENVLAPPPSLFAERHF